MHLPRKGLIAAGAAVILCSVVSAGASAATAATRHVVGPRAAASGGTWGTAEQVSGLGAGSQVVTVSCASAGNCSAGGVTSNESGFVASQAGGVWGTAQQVGGVVSGMSCPAPGDCSASGFTGSGNTQAFLISETDGTWGAPMPVPGLAALTTGSTNISGPSCASAGNCSAGGFYFDEPNQYQAFVVSEVNGTWGTAEEVPGIAALNQGGQADIESVSCASAGNCSAGGYYTNSSSYQQPFIVNQTAGTWGTAESLPPAAILNSNSAAIDSVSCSSAGNCTAAGPELNLHRSFVVREVKGTWRKPQTVAGLSGDWYGAINSLSCASPGNCAAGGTYETHGHAWGAFLINDVNGKWGSAQPVPGVVPAGAGAGTRSVSCISPGNCAAAGSYVDASGAIQAFVVDETNDTWGTAEEVPGTASLNTGGVAGTSSVSCTSPGNCSAGGSYDVTYPQSQAFVVSETTGTLSAFGQSHQRLTGLSRNG